MWHLWSKALGQKATEYNKEANKIAIIRTVVIVTYILTNAIIAAGVIKHWNDNVNTELVVELQVQDKQSTP